jgi:O-antigen ligase
LGALIGAAVFYLVLALGRARPVTLAAVLCVATTAVLAVLWVEQGSSVVSDAFKLGRVEAEFDTLQGRTLLWQEARTFVRARPWLGFGHDSFWSPARMEQFTAAVRWPIQNAHSNYLDVLLGLGGIGLVVFICILWMSIWRASRLAVQSGKCSEFFIASLLAFLALHGLLETTLIGPSFLTFLFMTVIARLGFPGELLGTKRRFP